MTDAQGIQQTFVIREAQEEDFGPLWQLMVSVYSNSGRLSESRRNSRITMTCWPTSAG